MSVFRLNTWNGKIWQTCARRMVLLWKFLLYLMALISFKATRYIIVSLYWFIYRSFLCKIFYKSEWGTTIGARREKRGFGATGVTPGPTSIPGRRTAGRSSLWRQIFITARPSPVIMEPAWLYKGKLMTGRGEKGEGGEYNMYCEDKLNYFFQRYQFVSLFIHPCYIFVVIYSF